MTRPDFQAQRAAAQKYFARCLALSQAGKEPVILAKRQNPTEWQAWKTYYRANGLLASIDLMNERAVKAVPTLDPADFEPTTASATPDRRVKDD